VNKDTLTIFVTATFNQAEMFQACFAEKNDYRYLLANFISL
jgi:hypothetical protein